MQCGLRDELFAAEDGEGIDVHGAARGEAGGDGADQNFCPNITAELPNAWEGS
jgi:hypothetical protein